MTARQATLIFWLNLLTGGMSLSCGRPTNIPCSWGVESTVWPCILSGRHFRMKSNVTKQTRVSYTSFRHLLVQRSLPLWLDTLRSVSALPPTVRSHASLTRTRRSNGPWRWVGSAIWMRIQVYIHVDISWIWRQSLKKLSRQAEMLVNFVNHYYYKFFSRCCVMVLVSRWLSWTRLRSVSMCTVTGWLPVCLPPQTSPPSPHPSGTTPTRTSRTWFTTCLICLSLGQDQVFKCHSANKSFQLKWWADN